MDYIKLIGAALVIIAGAGFGSCGVKKMKERTKEFEELYFCLLRLKSEINHGVKPLPEAIFCAAERKDGNPGGGFRNTMTALSKKMTEGKDAYETLLRNCVTEHLSGGVIKKEEEEGFVSAFLLLGGSDRAKQVQTLEYYSETIRELISTEKSKRKEQAYLYRSLGLLGGIFLSVILY